MRPAQGLGERWCQGGFADGLGILATVFKKTIDGLEGEWGRGRGRSRHPAGQGTWLQRSQGPEMMT